MSSIKRGLVSAQWQRMASGRESSNQMANGGSRRPKEKSRRGNRVSRRPTETWRHGNQRSRRPEEKVRPGNRLITPAKRKNRGAAIKDHTGLFKNRGGASHRPLENSRWPRNNQQRRRWPEETANPNRIWNGKRIAPAKRKIAAWQSRIAPAKIKIAARQSSIAPANGNIAAQQSEITPAGCGLITIS